MRLTKRVGQVDRFYFLHLWEWHWKNSELFKIIKSNVCDCSLPVQNKTDTGSRVCDNSILIFRLRERGEREGGRYFFLIVICKYCKCHIFWYLGIYLDEISWFDSCHLQKYLNLGEWHGIVVFITACCSKYPQFKSRSGHLCQFCYLYL